MGRGKGDVAVYRFCTHRRARKERTLSSEKKSYQEAFEIVEDKPWPEGIRLGLFLRPDYLGLRLQTLMKFFGVEPDDFRTLGIKAFPAEAEKKMAKEVGILLSFMLFTFLPNLNKASKENNQTFLNAARKLFGDYAICNYLNLKALNKGRGKIVSMDGLMKSYTTLRGWAFRQLDETPKDFATFDKPRGLCMLAYKIHHFLQEPSEVKILRARVIIKVRLLIKKHYLSPYEIFPGISLTPALNEDFSRAGLLKTKGKTSSRRSQAKKGESIPLAELFRGWNDDMKSIDQQLEKLKDI